MSGFGNSIGYPIMPKGSSRETETLKRLLKMPPQPHVSAKKIKAKASPDRKSNPKAKPE
jgi:hypothetical protein